MYSALFLSRNSISMLKTLFGIAYANVFLHHITLAFGSTRTNGYEMGKMYRIKVIGYLKTDKLDCLVVEANSDNELAHITISTNDGIKPFQSNAELALNGYNKVKTPIYIYAKCGIFKNGVIHFE